MIIKENSYLEVMEKGPTVNSERYMAFLQDNFRDEFMPERNFFGCRKMLLIVDNARPHISCAALSMLARKGMRLPRKPPYSLDFNFNDPWVH